MKKMILSTAAIISAALLQVQILEKMQWFNEPDGWRIEKGDRLVMDVTPHSDYWRISHNGFTVAVGMMRLPDTKMQYRI